jgi:hypothetical protein
MVNKLFIAAVVVAQITIPLPVGETHRGIKPYYTFETDYRMIIIRPKNPNYCPPQEGDYQCPMENSNPPEKERPNGMDTNNLPIFRRSGDQASGTVQEPDPM